MKHIEEQRGLRECSSRQISLNHNVPVTGTGGLVVQKNSILKTRAHFCINECIRTRSRYKQRQGSLFLKLDLAACCRVLLWRTLRHPTNKNRSVHSQYKETNKAALVEVVDVVVEWESIQVEGLVR